MHKFSYGNAIFEYEVEYCQNRKNISIIVESPDIVLVKSPPNTSQEKIRDVVKRKAQWIKAKLKEIEGMTSMPQEREYVSGESFSYLGKSYRLKVVDIDNLNDEGVKLIQGRLIAQIPRTLKGSAKKARIQALLKRWYVEHAEDKINEKVTLFSRKLGIKPTKVIVKEPQKRWGSCTKSGVVNINWLIIMAHHSIIDYVIVHELCHLKHKNHTHEFWKTLSSIIPDYEERKRWLKANGSTLSFQ